MRYNSLHFVVAIESSSQTKALVILSLIEIDHIHTIIICDAR
jgi:hypothetical protein